MIIKNYQQFYDFIKDENLPIKTELLNCITSVIKTCNCKKELRRKRSEQCNELYVNWIKNNASNYKAYWKQKTNSGYIRFFQNETFEILTVRF